MKNILEEFAYGNILLGNQVVKPNSELGQAMCFVAINEEKLLGRLNDEEKEIFQKYIDAQSEVNQLIAVKNFICGYKLGLIMTAEAFIGCGELAGGE
jgi:hypothetical protein